MSNYIPHETITCDDIFLTKQLLAMTSLNKDIILETNFG